MIRYFIAGGAGFIGGHFTDRILRDQNASVTVYDNFSSGREWHVAHHAAHPGFKIVKADIKDLETLKTAMAGHDVVIHLASNPDIARAATQPDIDFWEGTYLTNNVLEAMRQSGVPKILYASGSGVYGDIGFVEAKEDFGPMVPISTYGASKLSGEALIASYCFMFGLSGCAFRFGNVVGSRQTHGVGFDFIRKLRANPRELAILGDGTQSKSYIHVSDVIRAVLLAHQKCPSGFQVFNVATGDYITVKEIADLACRCLGLKESDVAYRFSGGGRGWKGDVPIVRLNTEKIRGLGWSCEMNCAQALGRSMESMLGDFADGRMTSAF